MLNHHFQFFFNFLFPSVFFLSYLSLSFSFYFTYSFFCFLLISKQIAAMAIQAPEAAKMTSTIRLLTSPLPSAWIFPSMIMLRKLKTWKLSGCAESEPQSQPQEPIAQWVIGKQWNPPSFQSFLKLLPPSARSQQLCQVSLGSFLSRRAGRCEKMLVFLRQTEQGLRLQRSGIMSLSSRRRARSKLPAYFLLFLRRRLLRLLKCSLATPKTFPAASLYSTQQYSSMQRYTLSSMQPFPCAVSNADISCARSSSPFACSSLPTTPQTRLRERTWEGAEALAQSSYLVAIPRRSCWLYSSTHHSLFSSIVETQAKPSLPEMQCVSTGRPPSMFSSSTRASPRPSRPCTGQVIRLTYPTCASKTPGTTSMALASTRWKTSSNCLGTLSKLPLKREPSLTSPPSRVRTKEQSFSSRPSCGWKTMTLLVTPRCSTFCSGKARKAALQVARRVVLSPAMIQRWRTSGSGSLRYCRSSTPSRSSRSQSAFPWKSGFLALIMNRSSAFAPLDALPPENSTRQWFCSSIAIASNRSFRCSFEEAGRSSSSGPAGERVRKLKMYFPIRSTSSLQTDSLSPCSTPNSCAGTATYSQAMRWLRRPSRSVTLLAGEQGHTSSSTTWRPQVTTSTVMHSPRRRMRATSSTFWPSLRTCLNSASSFLWRQEQTCTKTTLFMEAVTIQMLPRGSAWQRALSAEGIGSSRQISASKGEDCWAVSKSTISTKRSYCTRKQRAPESSSPCSRTSRTSPISSKSISASYSIRNSSGPRRTSRKFSRVPAISLRSELQSSECWKSKRSFQACVLVSEYRSQVMLGGEEGSQSPLAEAKRQTARLQRSSRQGTATRKKALSSFIGI